MDDTLVILKAKYTQQFPNLLNSLNTHTQFTPEAPNEQGSLPFLDTSVSAGPNSSLVTSVYRKPTDMDQYLHWDSHHSISTKYNVYNTLTHRARTICLDWELLGQEQQHIRITISRYNYPDWVFHRLQTKLTFNSVSITATLIRIRTRTPKT